MEVEVALKKTVVVKALEVVDLFLDSNGCARRTFRLFHHVGGDSFVALLVSIVSTANYLCWRRWRLVTSALAAVMAVGEGG